MMPKMHLLAAVVAPRGYGKGVITTNLIEQLKVVDRLILVSPSAASNKALNDRLKKILAPEDIFTDPNDISVLDKIVSIVEQERDDYEEYWDKKRKYDLLMKKLLACVRHSPFPNTNRRVQHLHGRRGTTSRMETAIRWCSRTLPRSRT